MPCTQQLLNKCLFNWTEMHIIKLQNEEYVLRTHKWLEWRKEVKKGRRGEDRKEYETFIFSVLCHNIT